MQTSTAPNLRIGGRGIVIRAGAVSGSYSSRLGTNSKKEPCLKAHGIRSMCTISIRLTSHSCLLSFATLCSPRLRARLQQGPSLFCNGDPTSRLQDGGSKRSYSQSNGQRCLPPPRFRLKRRMKAINFPRYRCMRVMRVASNARGGDESSESEASFRGMYMAASRTVSILSESSLSSLLLLPSPPPRLPVFVPTDRVLDSTPWAISSTKMIRRLS